MVQCVGLGKIYRKDVYYQKRGLSVDVPIFSLKPSLGKWLVNHGKSHYIPQFVYSIGQISWNGLPNRTDPLQFHEWFQVGCIIYIIYIYIHICIIYICKYIYIIYTCIYIIYICIYNYIYNTYVYIYIIYICIYIYSNYLFDIYIHGGFLKWRYPNSWIFLMRWRYPPF